jgi:hypothetical protein
VYTNLKVNVHIHDDPLSLSCLASNLLRMEHLVECLAVDFPGSKVGHTFLYSSFLWLIGGVGLWNVTEYDYSWVKTVDCNFSLAVSVISIRVNLFNSFVERLHNRLVLYYTSLSAGNNGIKKMVLKWINSYNPFKGKFITTFLIIYQLRSEVLYWENSSYFFK